jgi:hypothetical protein
MQTRTFRLSVVAPLAVLWLSACSSSPSTLGTPHQSTVTQMTGAQGGTVSLPGGGATLSVPPGALGNTQSISITTDPNASPPSGVVALSPFYEFGPQGLTFSSPVTVTFAYSGSATPVIVWEADDGSSPETVPTTANGATVSGQVAHFSRGFVADARTVSSIPMQSMPGSDAGSSVVVGVDAAGTAGDDASASAGGVDASASGSADATSGGEPDAATGAADAGATSQDASVTTSVDSSSPSASADSSAPPPVDSGTASDAGEADAGEADAGEGDAGSTSCAVCSNGFCGTSCPAGTQACGSGSPQPCIDVQSDSNNCGGCGMQCPAGRGCLNGQCAASCGLFASSSGCGSSPSADGGIDCQGCTTPDGGPTTACNGSCVNLDSDDGNCGTCGNTCGTGQSCQSGACTPVCASGDVCVAGLCSSASCPTGTAACGGSAGTAFCDDLASDPNNCGACGMQCPGGETCVQGVCATTVSCGVSSGTGCGGAPLADGGVDCSSCDGATACGSQCVFMQTDTNNCGACGTQCAVGQTCSAGVCGPLCPNHGVCANGICAGSCPTGMRDCSNVPITVTAICVDVLVDAHNCGGCNVVCPQGQGCDNGACVAVCSSSSAADAGVAAADGGGP